MKKWWFISNRECFVIKFTTQEEAYEFCEHNGMSATECKDFTACKKQALYYYSSDREDAMHNLKQARKLRKKDITKE